TRITFHSDIEKSVENIDLVIEAIPEVIDIKKDFYKELGKVSPEKTIFATNTSTLLPSQFAQDTGRPEKFSALHFTRDIREKNKEKELIKVRPKKIIFATNTTT